MRIKTGSRYRRRWGTYGTFALGEDGEWTYTLDNTDEHTDALGAGQEKTEAFTVTSLGGTTARVVVTVTGADDAAVIGGDTEGAVTEDDVDAARASGTLTVSDPDAGQDGFEGQTEVGTYGTFALGEDGEWTYTLDNTNEDTDALGAGQKKTEARDRERLRLLLPRTQRVGVLVRTRWVRGRRRRRRSRSRAWAAPGARWWSR